MQTLVVDANFLMSAYRFKIDVMDELERLIPGDFRLVVPTSVLRELRGIAANRGASGPQARYALRVISEKGIEVVESSGAADDWILEYCESEGALACTNDAELRKSLKAKGIRTIVLKGKSKLDYD